MKKMRKRALAALLGLIFLFNSAAPDFVSRAETDAADNSASMQFEDGSYYYYQKKYSKAERPLSETVADITAFTASKGAEVTLKPHENTEKALHWENGSGLIELYVNIEKEGCYQLAIDYFTVKSDAVSNPEFELYIDGQMPFKECAQISVPRLYRDETYKSMTDNDFETDNRGNDVCPNPTEISTFISYNLRDDTGANRNPYEFYLTEGLHKIGLVSLRDAIIICGIKFTNGKESISYEKYSEDFKEENTKDVFVEIEAEKTYSKTDASFYPVSNKTSAANTPIDPYATRLNVIGGSGWSNPMQEITWEFTVPKDGYYKIGMRFRQNFVRGLYTVRSVEIDGEQLFSELGDIRFPYSGDWQLKVLGDKDPYLFYLKEGRHTVTLIPTVSELSEDLLTVDNVVTQLNGLYSSIIMVTGTDPDMYRDYYLDETIPGLIDGMKDVSASLKFIAERIEKLTGNEGGMSATLDRICEQLDSFVKKPDTIPSRISSFQSNISSLSSWVLDLRRQSLMLDKLYILGGEDSFPKINATFFETLSYHISSFISSFVGDYTSIGNTYDKDEAVYIWLNGSRDVAGVLKTLIDSDFTEKTDIKVNANLTTTGLLAAVMADKGPDVAISVARGEPINLAIRGAVVPLNELDGFDKVVSEFSTAAMTPYYYRDECYALPVSQNFLMMFYRTDIFENMKLAPPKTWTDVYALAEVLQRNNMNIGIPTDLFYTLLFQMGGKLYNDELTATALDTTVAYDAFKMWCDLYTQYGLPLYKDDYNRFRTGELPLVITSYSFYNQLYATAPEIRNMWKMAPIPGLKDKNGKINNTSNASGTACMMLKGAKNRDNAWEFMKWWVSGETQGRYASQVESMLGVIARATPASRTALKRIAWTNSELDALLTQWDNIRETEEIPGGYYTTRNVNNAFNAVYYDGDNIRQTLSEWNKEIDSELERKRKEFEYVK